MIVDFSSQNHIFLGKTAKKLFIFA